jgi:YVTN family beta-propeller protein
VTPDGSALLVTNTADNTLSILDLEPEAKVRATVRTGQNPFEVIASDDSKTAYVSNFLGDSISVVDLATEKMTGFIRSGKQPAMIALDGGISGSGGDLLAVADLWLIDPATRKMVKRIPLGNGAHGVVKAGEKLFVTNSKDNTVMIVDPAEGKVLRTVAVANNPNGLTYMPPPSTR